MLLLCNCRLFQGSPRGRGRGGQDGKHQVRWCKLVPLGATGGEPRGEAIKQLVDYRLADKLLADYRLAEQLALQRHPHSLVAHKGPAD